MTATIPKDNTMLHTTLILLRKHHACARGYKMLEASLPEYHAADVPITLAHILKSNGIEDTLWALRATIEPTGRNVLQEIAVRAAERALPIFEKRRPDDNRVRECIAATRAFLRGEISHDNLITKRNAADAAAYAAAAAAADAADAADAARRIERDAQARDLRELLGVSP